MPSPARTTPSRSRLLLAAVLGSVVLVSACGGDPEPPADGEPTSGAPGQTSDGAASTEPAGTAPAEPVEQPPLPADPSGYTPDYVQATLVALYQDYRAALTAFAAAGTVDESVRTALAAVYHPDVLDRQVRNLEDYFPGGENLEDPPGSVAVTVTEIHSATADCILALTTYDVDAVITLDAPPEDQFFIGLARNPSDPDGTHPWLITVEYSTSDGEPLPADTCG